MSLSFTGLQGQVGVLHLKNKLACIKKLSETHHIVHAHGNNYGRIVSRIPDVIELTCIEKSYFLDGVPALNKSPLPIVGVDFANRKGRHDIDLNMFPFVSKD